MELGNLYYKLSKLPRGKSWLNIDLLTELNAKCEMENML